MLKISLLLMLVFVLVPKATAAGEDEEVLPAGTLLRCTLDEPHVSSRTARVGDPVLCHVVSLHLFGHSVSPGGAELAGQFHGYREPGRLVGKGWIELEFDRLLLPEGVTLPLSARVIAVPRLKVDVEGQIHGRGHPKRDAVGGGIPILWPVKVL